jgi:hypothetical protein
VIDAKVPIVKCAIGDEGNEVAVDISLSLDGRDKCRLIRHIYLAKPHVLLLFSLIFNFFRGIGIIKSALITKNTIAALKTTELQALILGILDLTSLLSPDWDSRDCSYKLSDIVGMLKSPSTEDFAWVGNKAIQFFTKIADMKSAQVPWLFTWPVRDRPVQIVDPSTFHTLSAVCHEALHALILSRSWLFTVIILFTPNNAMVALQSHCLEPFLMQYYLLGNFMKPDFITYLAPQ